MKRHIIHRCLRKLIFLYGKKVRYIKRLSEVLEKGHGLSILPY